ncbi:MAG: polysaccharide biosynthesis tyrosine autokinase [bacterium]|nr:polysaccharide biosynthesis tyrosine autokinase [bacterium]
MHQSNRINLEKSGIPGHEIAENSAPDIFKALWRWKVLATFGACLGLAMGYLFYRQQVPTYRSFALVQVVYPETQAAGLDTMDPEGIRGQSRLDESMIIKSARVVDLAIDIGKLGQQPILRDMNPSAVRDWILDKDRLTVEPSGRDASTALLDVSFVCEDPELSKLVVDSIIAGYETYLEQAYRSLGDDVARVVTQAQDRLRDSYQKLSDRHATFRKNAPMIWLGDQARNQFAENCIEINNSINKILIERQKLEATLAQVDEAQWQGRSPDGILMMLSSDGGLVTSLSRGPSMLETGIKASEALPFSSAERRRLRMELQMREEELLDNVGEEHPSVASVRRRIELLDRQINDITNSEREFEDGEHLELASLSPVQKVELWKKAIAERLAALSKQQELLTSLAADNEKKSKELQEYVTENQLLNSELASIQQLMEGFNGTLNRIQILPETNQRSLETLTPALAGGFYGPQWIPYLLGGAVVGFLILLGSGMLIDWFDQSFRCPEEISSALGLPILGHVPQMLLDNKAARDRNVDPAICTINGSMKDANEAYRAIRTSVYFSESGAANRVIQITSPSPGDGKSTLAANLAVSIAQSGRSVLLIDADMRRPRIAKLFGLESSTGLGEVILGKATLEEALAQSPVKMLSLLASNKQVRNPSELLSHQHFQDVLDTVRESYDYVIVDTPPVLAVADACAVAARVDGVLLTIRLRRDSKPAATQAGNALGSVGSRVLGVVVNGVARGEGYDYDYYGYSYGYSELDAPIEGEGDHELDLIPRPKSLQKRVNNQAANTSL